MFAVFDMPNLQHLTQKTHYVRMGMKRRPVVESIEIQWMIFTTILWLCFDDRRCARSHFNRLPNAYHNWTFIYYYLRSNIQYRIRIFISILHSLGLLSNILDGIHVYFFFAATIGRSRTLWFSYNVVLLHFYEFVFSSS